MCVRSTFSFSRFTFFRCVYVLELKSAWAPLVLCFYSTNKLNLFYETALLSQKLVRSTPPGKKIIELRSYFWKLYPSHTVVETHEFMNCGSDPPPLEKQQQRMLMKLQTPDIPPPPNNPHINSHSHPQTSTCATQRSRRQLTRRFPTPSVCCFSRSNKSFAFCSGREGRQQKQARVRRKKGSEKSNRRLKEGMWRRRVGGRGTGSERATLIGYQCPARANQRPP